MSSLALDDVSLMVYAGEVMCLLGDNGAGKSTLIKILSGVYRPTQGKIRIKGREVHFRSPAHAIRKGVATIPVPARSRIRTPSGDDSPPTRHYK